METKEKKFRKGTGRLMLDTLSNVRFDLFLGIALSLVATFLGLLSPIILKKLIDVEISPKVGIVNKKTFIMTAAMYMGSILFTNVFNYVKTLQLKRTSNKAAHSLRQRLYFHTLGLPLSFL